MFIIPYIYLLTSTMYLEVSLYLMFASNLLLCSNVVEVLQSVYVFFIMVLLIS